jgi:hypothetical protein
LPSVAAGHAATANSYGALQKMHGCHAQLAIVGFEAESYLRVVGDLPPPRKPTQVAVHLLPRRNQIKPAAPPPAAGFFVALQKNR